VNSTLAQNQAIVEEVVTGIRSHAVVFAKFKSVTGIEAVAPNVRSQPYIRETYGVGVVIVHDRSSPKGYTVWTAFPSNR
jgi:glycerate kinase